MKQSNNRFNLLNKWTPYILWIFIIGYIILFSFMSIYRYRTLNSHYYDLGIMNQVVYNTYKGNFLEMTNQDLMANVSRLAIHFDPILAFFAPFYFIYTGPETLLVLQTIAVALGAWAVYLLTIERFKHKIIGLLLALTYLMYYPVQRATLFDVHAVVFATPLLLFTIYFIRKKKFVPVICLVILSLLTKEHVGLVTFLLGLYVIFFEKERKLGLIICILSLVFFVSTVFFIIPYTRQATHFAVKYFEDIGDSPGEILFGLFKNPLLIKNYIFRPDDLKYLSNIFFPHIIFLIFSPFIALIAAPEVLINTISINNNMRSIYFHYNSLIVPFLFYGVIVGMSRFNKVVTNNIARVVIYTVYIGFFLYSIYLFDPLPIKFGKQPYWWGTISAQKDATIWSWKNQLADDSLKVATTPKLAPFFTNRRYYYNFLYDPAFKTMQIDQDDIMKGISKYNQADYVVIYTKEVGYRKGNELPYTHYQHLLNNQSFDKIFEGEEIEVYKKITNYQ